MTLLRLCAIRVAILILILTSLTIYAKSNEITKGIERKLKKSISIIGRDKSQYYKCFFLTKTKCVVNAYPIPYIISQRKIA